MPTLSAASWRAAREAAERAAAFFAKRNRPYNLHWGFQMIRKAKRFAEEEAKAKFLEDNP